MEIKKINTIGNVEKFLSDIYDETIKLNVSDIHFEPFEDKFEIKYRINGDLISFYEGKKYEYDQVVTKIKIDSYLRVDEKRLPQNGQFVYKGVDMRVATIGSLYGEKVVIRVLKKDMNLLNINKLGYTSRELDLINKSLTKTYGLIVIGGPTGSGKTTTLYAMLNNFIGKNLSVYTLEDPIEYKIPGITQIQIKPEIGFTYFEGLKQLLRLDPDVILIGEIRDSAVAKMAIEASLTGHLVLTTLHANNTVGIVQRFLEWGIERYLVASALLLLMSQRLVKKLCDCCEKSFSNEIEEIYEKYLGKDLNQKLNENTKFNLYKPNGCDKCIGTGYSGRINITEVVYVDDLVKSIILNNKLDLWNSMMIKNGYLSLFQTGLIKAKKGLIDIYQILPYKD